MSSNNTRLRVAEAAASSGDSHLAESVFARAAADAPTDTKLQLDDADALIRDGKIVEARNLLASRMNTVREPRRLRGPLGQLFVLTGQPTLAISEFDAAIAADPTNLRWMVDKAVALDMLGNHDAAQTLYRKALVVEPDDYITVTNLALSLALSGQKAEAAKVAATLSGRSDLSQRAVLTYDVVRAANGDDVSSDRATIGSNYDQLMRIAKAIDDRRGTN